MTERLKWRLAWRLSVLWILQWGISGAILTYLPLYFNSKGLDQYQLSLLMAVSAIGLWIAPLVVGQVCDRWLATEKYLAVAHFVGGVTLVSIPIATNMYTQTRDNFGALLTLVGIYCCAYLPTIPLASSLTFRHLPDPDRQFGRVRIWGTVGWVLSGLSLSLWLGQREAYEWLATHHSAWKPYLDEIRATFSWVSPPSSDDSFRIAALLSFALSSFCVFLPSTPPARADRGAIAPFETLKMFRDRDFTLLIATSFLLALVVPLYSFAVPQLLKQDGYDSDWIPAVMTIGQISEFPALLLLPLCLRRLGLKTTFAIGMLAWLVRYLVFAVQGPTWLLLTAIGLHGVCHVFLIIVIQLYVDSQCRYDLRASAQNLFAFLTMGIAMPLGFLFAGLLGRLTTDDGETNFRVFFSVPAAFILLLILAYWKWVDLSSRNPAPDGAASPRKQARDSHEEDEADEAVQKV